MVTGGSAQMCSSKANMQQQDAFTLIELMIVIGLVAVLAMFAIPGFQRSIANQDVKAAAQTIYLGINQARGEARRLSGTCNVIVVPKNVLNWGEGLDIFALTVGAIAPGDALPLPAARKCDLNGDGDTDDAGEDSAVLVAEVAGTTDVVVDTGASFGGGEVYVMFNRLGRVSYPDSLSMEVCDAAAYAHKRVVSIGVSGLPRQEIGDSYC